MAELIRNDYVYTSKKYIKNRTQGEGIAVFTTPQGRAQIVPNRNNYYTHIQRGKMVSLSSFRPKYYYTADTPKMKNKRSTTKSLQNTRDSSPR